MKNLINTIINTKINTLKYSLICLLLSVTLTSTTKATLNYTLQGRSDLVYRLIPHDSFYASNKDFSLKVLYKQPKLKLYLDPQFAWFNAKLIGSNDIYRFYLPQAYLRLNLDPFGTVSMGKIKINTSYPSLFNPLSYENQLSFITNSSNIFGKNSISWEAYLTYDAGFRVYYIENNGMVATVFDHIFNTDYGVVGIKKEDGSKVIGGYFKGDFEVGIESAIGYYLTPENKQKGIQYTLGIDYSVGPVFFKATKIYQDKKTLSYSNLLPDYLSLGANNYVLAEVSFPCDEFSSFSTQVLINTDDRSSLLITDFKYALDSSSDLDIIYMFPTGISGKEFSIQTYGVSNLILRINKHY